MALDGEAQQLRVALHKERHRTAALLDRVAEMSREQVQDVLQRLLLKQRTAQNNKHSTGTAEKTYVVIPPEEDAKNSKIQFYELWGEPVAFPTWDEWRAQQSKSLEELLAKAKRSKATCDDLADEEDSSGDEEDDDSGDGSKGARMQ